MEPRKGQVIYSGPQVIFCKRGLCAYTVWKIAAALPGKGDCLPGVEEVPLGLVESSPQRELGTYTLGPLNLVDVESRTSEISCCSWLTVLPVSNLLGADGSLRK